MTSFALVVQMALTYHVALVIWLRIHHERFGWGLWVGTLSVQREDLVTMKVKQQRYPSG